MLRGTWHLKSESISANKGKALVKKAMRGRPVGSVQVQHKHPTTLRLDEEVLRRWRASGKGWQTRAAEVLAVHAPTSPATDAGL